MKSVACVCAAVALAACAGPGRHGPGGPHGPGMSEGGAAVQCLLVPFALADGSLPRASLEAGVDRLFAAADTDSSGGLDAPEVRALNAARKTGCDRSPVIDYGGTGYIDRHAFGSRYATAFSKADTDRDGTVSAAEMAAARRPPRLPPERGRQGRGGPGPETP